jgi:hypothetical protein
MRVSILASAIMLLFSVSVASAFTLDLPTIQKYADVYNSRVDKAPGVLKAILGDEQINLDVTRDDASHFVVGMDLKNARIEKTIEGGWQTPTIVITTTESAINDVRRAKDPIAAFQGLREEGQINFEAKNWITGVKLEAVLSSTSVLQFGYKTLFG